VSASPGSRLELLAPAASPEEAAAIVAALERFMRATAPPPAGGPLDSDGWRVTALLEAVDRDPGEPQRHAWINT
jgi:hypothetical protein